MARRQSARIEFVVEEGDGDWNVYVYVNGQSHWTDIVGQTQSDAVEELIRRLQLAAEVDTLRGGR